MEEEEEPSENPLLGFAQRFQLFQLKTRYETYRRIVFSML